MICTPLHFFTTRFTSLEQLAVAASTVPEVQLYRMLMGMAERVDSNDPRLEQGKQLLIATGIITPERAAVIFDFLDP